MILLKDIDTFNLEIQKILTLSAKDLQSKSITDKNLLKLSGTSFEKVVCDTLNKMSVNTGFDKKFEQSKAHDFPDIYAKILENKWFGVEVKTSQGDWKCFGNSIFESTRIENLEDRIYIFFGKFSTSSSRLECKWARYDECIDNINITHSPRYQINMEIKDNRNDSIFTKMGISYLDFSNSDTTKRMDYVRKYKRKGLGPNAALWWLPTNDDINNDDEQKLVIKLFKDLSTAKKQEITYAAIAFFPELFSNDRLKKYARVLPWLVSQYGVVTASLRDIFSAGGQTEVFYKGKKFRLPKIFFHLNAGVQQIKATIINSTNEDLVYRWDLPNHLVFKNNREKLIFWISKISENLEHQGIPKDFPMYDWLNSLFL